MKNLNSRLLFLFTLCTSIIWAGPILIKGKVVGWNGQILPLAHVQVAPIGYGIYPKAPIAFSQVDPEGNYVKNSFRIDGRIEGIEDNVLITLVDIDQQKIIDSAYTKYEKFVLTGKVINPTTCWLRNGNKYAIIEVENIPMVFNSPLENMLHNSSIKGGREQNLRNELNLLQRPYAIIYTAALDSLMNKKYKNKDDEKRLGAIYNENQTASHMIYIDFALNHPDSYMGLDIIYINRKSISRDSILILYNNLSQEYKSTPAANAIKTFLFDEIAKIGEPFIDFEAETIEGKPFKLSAKKGNYVYLTFWSSGCGYCRMKNRHMSENFSRIPKGLSVVSFSTDINISDWKMASTKDNILWDNVSDNAGGRGKVKTQYEVQAIPTSFLMDRDGVIKERFTGFDKDEDIFSELKRIIDLDKK